MNRLFLFNPENDMALAHGRENYTPTRQAQALHHAGAPLPYWLGDSSDSLLVSPEQLKDVETWCMGMETRGIAGPHPVCRIDDNEIVALVPWGWSRNTVNQLAKAGVNMDLMRDRIRGIDRHRALSHRRTASKLYTLMDQHGLPLYHPQPQEVDSIEGIRKFMRSYCDKVMVKSPWSSSGRGVFAVDKVSLEREAVKIEGIIRSQGSVMVEARLDILAEFAMLFDYIPAGARFAGLSHFCNASEHSTNYHGNFVGSDAMILELLTQYVALEEIARVREMLCDTLPLLLGPDYSGPVGVDMLIFKASDGSARINPCMELNLRLTMGFVAAGIFSKLQRPGWMKFTPKTRGKSIPPADVALIPENPWFSVGFYAQV